MIGRHAAGEAESAAEAADAPAITVIGGNPTASELAAVTAVIAALAQEQSDDDRSASEPTTSAWQRSQRSLRPALEPGPGAWRGFSA